MSERPRVRRGPTGVAELGPGLPADVKEQLRTIAAPKAGEAADLDGFTHLVDMAAKQYWAARSLQKEALPATVRAELKAAYKASHRLIDRLNDLGGTSRHLLYSKELTGDHARFSEAPMYVAGQLARARHHADELSRSAGELRPGPPCGAGRPCDRHAPRGEAHDHGGWSVRGRTGDGHRGG